MKDPNGQQGQPGEIPVPPTQFTVGLAELGGKRWGVLTVQIFMTPNAAKEMAQAMHRVGQAAGSGLIVPNVVMPPLSDEDGGRRSG